MQEVFRSIPNYKGLYEVSNLGRVKSLGNNKAKKEKIRVQRASSNGYLQVNLSKKGKFKSLSIHQLVAFTFLNHTPSGYKVVVDHIDNNKLNNRLDNLHIITQRQNASKDKTGGSSEYVGVTWRKDSKKWRSRIEINSKVKNLGCFINEIDAHNAYQTALKQHLEVNL